VRTHDHGVTFPARSVKAVIESPTAPIRMSWCAGVTAKGGIGDGATAGATGDPTGEVDELCPAGAASAAAAPPLATRADAEAGMRRVTVTTPAIVAADGREDVTRETAPGDGGPATPGPIAAAG
jgi:hypothetical protein